MRVQLPGARLVGQNVVWGLVVTIAIVVGTVVGTFAFMIMVHIICSLIGIDGAGIWFYGDPSLGDWGFNFFNVGGLELSGPSGLGFFSCTGQC